MNIADLSALSSLVSAPLAVPAPRAVKPDTAQQFRELMSTSGCDQKAAPCESPAVTRPSLGETLNMDIEKVLMAHMPSANASPAEFAVGLLRAQVKVSQAAIAIELVSKTTQSLSQGVQSLTTRS